MRNTLVAAAALLVVTASTAFADGKQDFDLVNRTGYTIDKVFVSPSNSNDWEDDVLGRDVLDDGEKVHIRFNRAAKSCKWDLKVVYSDGEKGRMGRIRSLRSLQDHDPLQPEVR